MTAGSSALGQSSLSETATPASSAMGAIVGGVIGGVAILVIAGLFIFTAMRKGWFDKKNRNIAEAPTSAPIGSGAATRNVEAIAVASPVELHNVDASHHQHSELPAGNILKR